MATMRLLANSAKVLFGVLVLPYAFGALLTIFMFGGPAPAAFRNLLAWNLALSIWGYFPIYGISLTKSSQARQEAASDKAVLQWSLLPLVGIAWTVLAYFLMTFLGS